MGRDNLANSGDTTRTLIIALLLSIPSHQPWAFPTGNGVETRGQGPESTMSKGQSIVQTTNRKSGESRSGKALTLDNVCQLAVFKNTLDQTGKDSNARTKLLSVYMSSPASSFCANTGTSNGSNLQFGLPVVFGTSAARLSAVSKTTPSVSARFGPIAVRKGVNRLRGFDAMPFADGNYVGVLHPTTMNSGLGNPDLKAWYLNWNGKNSVPTLKLPASLVTASAILSYIGGTPNLTVGNTEGRLVKC